MLDERAVLEFVRVLGSSLARVAEAASAIFGAEVFIPVREQATPLELAQLDELGRSALLRVPAALDPLFRHVHDATMHRATRAFDPANRDAIPLAVGFVDLVGFTPLSRRLSTLELSAMVTEFETRPACPRGGPQRRARQTRGRTAAVSRRPSGVRLATPGLAGRRVTQVRPRELAGWGVEERDRAPDVTLRTTPRR